MKHIFTGAICACLLSACSMRDPRLYGTWKSDAELTNKFNEDHSKLPDSQREVFPQMFGHLALTYEPRGTLTLKMDAYSMSKGTNTFQLSEWSDTTRFTIVEKNNSSVVIKHPGTLDPEEECFTVMHFEQPDLYWIYLGHGEFFSLHLREYFRKVAEPQQ